MATDILKGANSGQSFKLGEMISRSDFSTVRKAIGEDGKEYAIKRPLRLSGPLSREAEKQARFNDNPDAHITPIVLFDKSARFPRSHFLVTPLAAANLTNYRRMLGGITPKEAFSISEQMAEALCAMHEKELMHIDVKPENVLMRKNPTELGYKPELTDFGSARYFSESGKSPRTRLYAPPERQNSPNGDQYSWAAGVVYPSFTGQSASPFLMGNFSNAYVPPRTMEAIIGGRSMTYLHDVAQEVTAQALQANSTDRYSSMGDLLEDLRTKRAKAESAHRKRRTQLFDLSRFFRD